MNPFACPALRRAAALARPGLAVVALVALAAAACLPKAAPAPVSARAEIDRCGPLPSDLPRENPFQPCFGCHRGDDAEGGNLYLDAPRTLRAALAENPWFADDVIDRVRARFDHSSAAWKRHKEGEDPPYFMPPNHPITREQADAITRYLKVLARDPCPKH